MQGRKQGKKEAEIIHNNRRQDVQDFSGLWQRNKQMREGTIVYG